MDPDKTVLVQVHITTCFVRYRVLVILIPTWWCINCFVVRVICSTRGRENMSIAKGENPDELATLLPVSFDSGCLLSWFWIDVASNFMPVATSPDLSNRSRTALVRVCSITWFWGWCQIESYLSHTLPAKSITAAVDPDETALVRINTFGSEYYDYWFPFDLTSSLASTITININLQI